MAEKISVTFKPPEELLRSIERFATTDTDTLCDECLLPFPCTDLKRCTQCKEVNYCSKKCQARAWKAGHKMWCGTLAVKDIPGKGKGIVALRDIEIGEVLLKEKPLLLFPAGNGLTEALTKMPEINKRRVMQLYDRENTANTKRVLGILMTNCLAGRCATSVLYYMISRFNHSCIPNVIIDQQFPTSVTAIENIKEGMEISWCYNGDAMYQDRWTRNEELSQGWSIPYCKCPCCTLQGEEAKQSDANRLALKDVEHKIAKSIQEEKNHLGSFFELLKQKYELLAVEGLGTADNLAYIARDMLHGPLTEAGFEKYRADGLELAHLMKDHVLVKYFEDITMEEGCKGCFRCKPHRN